MHFDITKMGAWRLPDQGCLYLNSLVYLPEKSEEFTGGGLGNLYLKNTYFYVYKKINVFLSLTY
jgi:hypothetical protein